MPFFEFLPAELCESRLRKQLVRDALVFEHGSLAVPSAPGLGLELDHDALEEFSVAAREAIPARAA
jgi:L-alanine-DL-glutamate epimerase-like enolase superfamily enzyme